MSDTYSLDIFYQGIVHKIECTLRVSKYTYQFLCSTGNSEIIVEKDDEGNLRALEAEPFTVSSQKPESGLVKALMEELERILHPEI